MTGIINYTIERLHNLKINRLRVLLSGAADMFWGEPVMTGENFTLCLRPWIAQAPESVDHPGIDFTRFNVSLLAEVGAHAAIRPGPRHDHFGHPGYLHA